MSSSAFSWRRSERFAELLEEANGHRRHHRRTEHDGGLAILVRLTERVGVVEGPDPGQDFRGGLRAMLMAKIEREGIGTTADERVALAATRAALAGKTQVVPQVRTAGTGRTRAAVLIGVTAGALVLSGVSAASTDSLPGDPLYQVKRSSERAQLALAGSDQSRGQLYLEFAHSRLLEARSVGPSLLAEVFADMDRETLRGVNLLLTAAVQRGDAGGLGAVTQFVNDQRTRLADLRRTLAGDGAEPARRSTALLDQIDKRTKELAAALAGNGCVIAKADDLGPKPSDC